MGATAMTRLSFFVKMLSSSRNGYDSEVLLMKILINKLHPDAHLPAYAHGPLEDAGLDLRAVEQVVLEPGVAQAVPTGIAIELPPGHEAQVRPRSGMALKHCVTVNFGTIDPGYRGEIRVVMFNLGRADYVVEKG